MLPVSWSSVMRRNAVATVERLAAGRRAVAIEKAADPDQQRHQHASGISSAASRPEIANVATAATAMTMPVHLEAAGEPRRVGIDEQIHQQQEAAEDREPAEKVEHRRRSLAQLRGQTQHLAALLFAIGGQARDSRPRHRPRRRASSSLRRSALARSKLR